MRVTMWRLRSPSNGHVSECFVINHWPSSFEVRIVDGSSVTTASTRFLDTGAATKAAADMGEALRNDGWTDTSDI